MRLAAVTIPMVIENLDEIIQNIPSRFWKRIAEQDVDKNLVTKEDFSLTYFNALLN
jgi:hypothetical protein